jgi:hypothetical protein
MSCKPEEVVPVYKCEHEMVTDCCGAPPYGNGDSDTMDMGICPDCKEHCDYVELEDEN